MSESGLLEISYMFDIFFEFVENSYIDKRDTEENLTKIFKCASFIEATVAKAKEEKIEDILENYLYQHELEKKRSKIYKCSDLMYACDKLLEVFMKDTSISTTTVDNLLNMYTRTFGIDRLNHFLQRVLRNSICSNVILKSIEDLDVPESEIEDEALIVSWEVDAENGRQLEISRKIMSLLEDGYVSKIIYFVINLHDESKVKNLIVECLSRKVIENDVQFCLTLTSIKEKFFLKLLNDSSELCIHFIDAIFYFGRNMSKINDEWILNKEFNYNNLLKIIRILLNGSDAIRKIVCSRIQLAKMQPDGTIWHDIEKDIAL